MKAYMGPKQMMLTGKGWEIKNYLKQLIQHCSDADRPLLDCLPKQSICTKPGTISNSRSLSAFEPGQRTMTEVPEIQSNIIPFPLHRTNR